MRRLQPPGGLRTLGNLKSIVMLLAIPPNSSSCRVAVVLRNWRGDVLDGFARKVYARTSLRGEFLAIREVEVESR